MLFFSLNQDLGKSFEDGESITCQGDKGDCLFVVQEGRVEVLVATADRPPEVVAVLEKDEIFGEISGLTSEPRSATVRAVGKTRILSFDKKIFLQRIQDDPVLALRMVLKLSERIRNLNLELLRLRGDLADLQGSAQKMETDSTPPNQE